MQAVLLVVLIIAVLTLFAWLIKGNVRNIRYYNETGQKGRAPKEWRPHRSGSFWNHTERLDP